MVSIKFIIVTFMYQYSIGVMATYRFPSSSQSDFLERKSLLSNKDYIKHGVEIFLGDVNVVNLLDSYITTNTGFQRHVFLSKNLF